RAASKAPRSSSPEAQSASGHYCAKSCIASIARKRPLVRNARLYLSAGLTFCQATTSLWEAVWKETLALAQSASPAVSSRADAILVWVQASSRSLEALVCASVALAFTLASKL